jgi:3-oxoacyl-[acyl-carrier-protein] synthase-1/3-oxoacyl-[acyl-carrier-protein] synthase II
MLRKVITGLGVWTSAGRGPQALLRALVASEPAFDAPAPYDTTALKQPRCGIIPELDRTAPAEDLLLSVASDALEMAGLEPDPSRTGLVIGTTSGNISGPWERWHRAHLDGDPQVQETGTGRDAPTLALASKLGLTGPISTVSMACASGTAAFALAQGWIDDNLCDVVLVGGVDALSLYIHAGFNGLGALASDRPQPFGPQRDGLLLGEGGAVLVVEREDHARARSARALAEVLGSGMSGDAFHVTAPHREGRGAIRAMRAALRDAGLGPDRVDMVSLHGTATVFNDAMEARAMRAVFGDRPVPFHGIKGSVGHTLGAAGAVEAALVVQALQQGVQPPAPAQLADDCPMIPVPQAPAPPRIAPRIALSTNSAFGGANAATVLSLPSAATPPNRSPRDVQLLARSERTWAPGRIDLRAEWPEAPQRLSRTDKFVRAGVLMVREILGERTLPDHAGIVLATEFGCRITDLRYHKRLVQEGAGRISRMAFIYTIPGSPLAEASIVFGLQGPNLTLIGPPEQAEAEAARLIRWGRANVMIALSCDAPGPDLPAKATASLLAVAGWSAPENA